MKEIMYVLIFVIGGLLSYVFILYVIGHGGSMQESEMWITWIAVIGIALIVVFFGHEIYSKISE